MNCFKNRFYFWWENENGGVVIIVALIIVALLGMTALVVDVGSLYQTRRQMVTAADAGALAGAQELIYNRDNHNLVESVAKEYAINQNDAEPILVSVEIPNDYTVIVETGRNVDFTFARVLGFSDSDVPARAVAVVLPLEWAEGIVPWAIPVQDFEFGKETTLKYSHHMDGEIGPGNFHALALGAPGANKYKSNIINGYEGTIKIGDWLDTETGNMSGPTMQGVNQRIAKGEEYRYVTVPLFDEVLGPGSTKVKVAAFAVFYLIGVQGHGTNSVVVGKYVETIAAGQVGDPYNTNIDYGAYNIKLIE